MNEWGAEGVQPVEEINLRDYWVIVRKRRWIILTSVIVVALLGTLYSLMQRPAYRATATLLIDKELNILSSMEGFYYDAWYVQSEYLQTQYKLLQSRTLAERVVERLKLDQNPEFGFDPADKKADPAEAAERRGGIAGLVQAVIQVAPVKDTRLVNVSYTANDPALAATIANSLVNTFIEMDIERKYQATEQASAFLTEQVSDLRKTIANLERQLQDYSVKKSIVALSDKETTIVEKLGDLNRALTEAQIDRVRKEAVYKQLSGAAPDALQDVPGNEVFKSTKEDYVRLQREYQKKGEIFKPEYPEMIALKAELDNARRAVEAEARNLASSAYADYQAALKKEQALASMFDDQKSEATQLNSAAIQYNSIKIEIDNKKRLMEELLTKQSETGISARLRGLRTSNIRVVDRAEVPKVPIGPRTRRNALLSILLGLFAGLGLAFLIEHLDSSVKSTEEVERIAALPALGVIPALNPDSNRNGYYYYYYRRRTPGAGKSAKPAVDQPKSIDLIPLTASRSNIAEAYRAVRTAVLMASVDNPHRVFIVTSALPSEGKSATASNLAASLTQADKKVLLLDLDLRKPRLHRILGMKNVNGLTNYLSGAAEYMSIVRPTKVPGLFLVSSGPLPPNPAELLHSQKMAELMSSLRQHFDYVLIDSPPMLTVTDALVIAPRTDGVLLVVWGGKTSREALKRAREKMDLLKVHCIGVVLNNIDLERHDYYYRHHYYHYYYADQEQGKS
ncbi:MAG: polysaccharide biosynthesis tyrosine autokinase [Acidobacteriota bacterium]